MASKVDALLKAVLEDDVSEEGCAVVGGHDTLHFSKRSSVFVARYKHCRGCSASPSSM